MARAGRDQLVPAAITVSHADRLDTIGFRADHIMAAVADHESLRRIDAGLRQGVGQKIALVDAPAVQLGAEDMLEMASEAKMVDDPLGKDVRLAGRDEHPPRR